MLVALALAGCSGPSADEVRRQHRAEAEQATQHLMDQMEPLVGVGTPVGSAVRDSCETGQHNWKVDDAFDVRCTVQVTRAFQVDGSGFRPTAETVHAVFPDCPDGTSEGAEVLSQWDDLKGQPTKNFPGPYRPDYLPSYRLGCGTGSAEDPPEFEVAGWVSLPVEEFAAQEHEHAMGLPCGQSQDRPCELTGDTAADVWEQAGEDGWVVFVTATAEYARTG